MIYGEDPLRRGPGKSTAQENRRFTENLGEEENYAPACRRRQPRKPSPARAELHPRVGLDPLRGSSVTSLSRPAERVVAFYNQRGKLEQYIKEGKYAIVIALILG